MTFQKLWVIRNFGTEQGLHPGDLLVEFYEATLVDGEVDIPTRFPDGQIVGVQVTHKHDTVNQTEAFACDCDVDGDGKINIVGPTASTANIMVMVIGKPR